MDKQEKCEWLADFYTQASAGGAVQELCEFLNGNTSWVSSDKGPTLASDQADWRIEPELKVIDLSPLIGSGLDCEFWQNSWDDRCTGNLGSIEIQKYPYELAPIRWFKNCQPRMSTPANPYIHYWRGGQECPVPEGFEVRLHLRDGSNHLDKVDASEWRWSRIECPSDIIGIEFIAVKDTHTLAAQ